jgi:tRNA(fMet)-specific endonuclease VapC
MADSRFMLDTNICIYLLQGKSQLAVRRISQFRRGEIVASAIVYAEVMIGSARLNAVEKASAFFDLFPVLPFDQHAGDVYASLPFRRGSFDRLIAAHALSLGLTLVTNNEGDFADAPGLKVENWTV